MNYLFVVAHPDDETLGAGGMIYDLIKKKNHVTICILCEKASARSIKETDDIFKKQIIESIENLGCHDIILGDFPNIKFNTVPHLEIVKFIEDAIIKSKPDIIITHHPSDLNNDHEITSKCCQAAIRLPQRNNKIKQIQKFMYMEVLSSTDWDLNSSFRPNYFYEIGEKGLNKKIASLEIYKDVLREIPHPRSRENIKALATYRACQANLDYAESFEIVFERDV